MPGSFETPDAEASSCRQASVQHSTAELHRVYPLVPGELQEPPLGEPQETSGKQQEAPETRAMERELEVLRETVTNLRGERDKLLQVIERQTLLLQDQRPCRWRWWWR